MTMVTHTAVAGRAVARALASLSASTSLTVTVGGVAYRGGRLCSPFASHQNVAVTGAPHAIRGVLLENGRYTVHAIQAWSGIQPPPAPAGMEWHTVAAIAAPVMDACSRLAAIAPGLGWALNQELKSAIGAHLLHVSVLLPALVGWERDGTPIYAERPEPEPDELAGITEARFSPEDEPPAPADDDPEPGTEEG